MRKESGKMTEYRVNINGIDVNAWFSDENINGIFMPLLYKLTELQKEKKKRILAFLAAPPGAGKSTLVSFLQKLSYNDPDLINIQTIGMDGFHRRQEYLISHSLIRDGKEVTMVDVKGAPDTFDLEKLEGAIKKVAAGEKCGWPLYDRLLHNPVEDSITVDGSIVLLEGNYLLLNMDGWERLSSYADYTILIKAEENMLKDRLVSRRIDSGHSPESSEEFVDFSDMFNARLCLDNSKGADLVLKLNADGSYSKETQLLDL